MPEWTDRIPGPTAPRPRAFSRPGDVRSARPALPTARPAALSRWRHGSGPSRAIRNEVPRPASPRRVAIIASVVSLGLDVGAPLTPVNAGWQRRLRGNGCACAAARSLMAARTVRYSHPRRRACADLAGLRAYAPLGLQRCPTQPQTIATTRRGSRPEGTSDLGQTPPRVWNGD